MRSYVPGEGFQASALVYSIAWLVSVIWTIARMPRSYWLWAIKSRRPSVCQIDRRPHTWSPKWHWFVCRAFTRHTDPRPVWCDTCGWAGPRRWAMHGYQSIGSMAEGEVEPADFCPACGSEV